MRKLSWLPRLRPTIALACVLGGNCGTQLSGGAAVPPAPVPWPHEGSDLKPDPAVTWGHLDNGLRYAILPRGTPQHRVSVFLLVQAGSYQESPGELGYAHYVEHMVFRDTRDFPGDSAIETLQRLGLPFGAHVNADTSIFETTYHLDDLPSGETGALATGLKVLRSMAGGALFPAAAVEQERGVIFSERRARDSTLRPAWRDDLEFIPPRGEPPRWSELHPLFDGTRVVERPPIGTEKTLRAADARKLRAFYDRWYRPERMILAIAGDVAPAAVEQLVRETFATLAARGPAPAEIPIADSPPPSQPGPTTYAEISDTEPLVRLALCAVQPVEGPDNAARRARSLARQTALLTMELRLELATATPGAPFSSAETLLSHQVPGREITLLRVSARPSDWPKALTALNTELRRAREQGFTEIEFQRAVKRESLRAEVDAAQAPTEPATELCRALAFAAARGVAFTAAGDDRALLATQFGGLTREQCQAALSEIFSSGKLAIALLGPTGEGRQISGKVNAALAESAQATLVAPVSAAVKTFPYTDFGPAGAVVSNVHSAVLDADLVQFANGVRLNVKRTGFEAGRIRAGIRFGGGRLTCPPDQPGLDTRIFAWVLGGLDGLTQEEQSAALSDLSGDRSLDANSSNFVVLFDGKSSTLALELQSFAAYFVHPAFREEGWTRSLELARMQLAAYEATAAGVADTALYYRMSGHHPAMKAPSTAEVSERSFAEFKAWVSPLLATSPIEITVVGDCDPAQAIATVARTFGALPARAVDDPYAAQRRVNYPPVQFSETINFTGVKGEAVAVVAWPAPGDLPYVDRVHGNILAAILQDRLRLKLRIELGETYAPVALFGSMIGFSPLPSFLQCRVETAPRHVVRVDAAAREVAEALARDGATPDEFERARYPLVQSAESGLRDNNLLRGTLLTAQQFPADAEGGFQALPVYQSATLEQINALARRLLVPDRVDQLIVRPK